MDIESSKDSGETKTCTQIVYNARQNVSRDCGKLIITRADIEGGRKISSVFSTLCLNVNEYIQNHGGIHLCWIRGTCGLSSS